MMTGICKRIHDWFQWLSKKQTLCYDFPPEHVQCLGLLGVGLVVSPGRVYISLGAPNRRALSVSDFSLFAKSSIRCCKEYVDDILDHMINKSLFQGNSKTRLRHWFSSTTKLHEKYTKLRLSMYCISTKR